MTDIAQHHRKGHEKQRHWLRQPLLRDAYAESDHEVAERVVRRPNGPVVEGASGINNLKTDIPVAVATDRFSISCTQ